MPEYEILVYGTGNEDDGIKYFNKEDWTKQGAINKMRNSLCNIASKEFIVLMDANVELASNWYSNMMKADCFDIIGSRLITTDDKRAIDWAYQIRLDDHSFPFPLQYDEWTTKSYISGMLMVVRRSVLEQVKFNDSLLFWQDDDVEFCLRSSDIGFRLGVFPDAVAIYHYDQDVCQWRKYITFDKALGMVRDYKYAFAEGNNAFKNGDYDAAVKLFQRVIEITPKDISVWGNMGPLDLSRKKDRSHEGIIINKSRKEIEHLIDKAIQSQIKIKAASTPPHLAGSYKGYNIVAYNNVFYGVSQSMGTLDLSRKEDRSREGILAGKDIKKVEHLIDKAIQSMSKVQPKVKAVDQPPHLAGAYQGYNIVDYKGSFYAVHQSVGSLDLSKEENQNRAGFLIGKERKEVEQMIDKAILNQEKAADLSPRLVRSYKGYNIVEYNNRFYGVPQSLGTLDLHKEQDRNRDGILVGKDAEEVKTLIKNQLGFFRSRYWKLKDVYNTR